MPVRVRRSASAKLGRYFFLLLAAICRLFFHRGKPKACHRAHERLSLLHQAVTDSGRLLSRSRVLLRILVHSRNGRVVAPGWSRFFSQARGLEEIAFARSGSICLLIATRKCKP
jgi:hypothetical protein